MSRPVATSAWLALIALGVLFYPAVAGSARADIVGVASVIDVDTIEIHGQRIRLYGIDAPESCQTCEDASGRTWRCKRAVPRGSRAAERRLCPLYCGA